MYMWRYLTYDVWQASLLKELALQLSDSCMGCREPDEPDEVVHNGCHPPVDSPVHRSPARAMGIADHMVKRACGQETEKK